jgi:hypothetical protein
MLESTFLKIEREVDGEWQGVDGIVLLIDSLTRFMLDRRTCTIGCSDLNNLIRLTR